jgi:hypothetical protein
MPKSVNYSIRRVHHLKSTLLSSLVFLRPLTTIYMYPLYYSLFLHLSVINIQSFTSAFHLAHSHLIFFVLFGLSFLLYMHYSLLTSPNLHNIAIALSLACQPPWHSSMTDSCNPIVSSMCHSNQTLFSIVRPVDVCMYRTHDLQNEFPKSARKFNHFDFVLVCCIDIFIASGMNETTNRHQQK